MGYNVEHGKKGGKRRAQKKMEIYHTPYNTLYLNEDTDIKVQKYPVLIYSWLRGKGCFIERICINGGMIIGCRCKQENGKCVMLPQPGLAGNYWISDVRFYVDKPGKPSDRQMSDD